MQEFSPAEVGARIAVARKQTDGMTQEQLADLLGIAPRTLQTYEQGDRIPWKLLRQIASITGRPVEWLLRGEPEAAAAEQDSTEHHLEDIEVKLDRLTLVVEKLAEALADSRSDPSDGRSGQTGT